MKLIMATLLNFNINNKLTSFNNNHTSLHNDPGYKDLINQRKLLSKLLILTNKNNKQQYYQKKYKRSVLTANLNFKDLNFRYKYSKWIYSNYSNSMANHIMVQKNEASALFQWANQFNQHYNYLKIVKIIPKIDENQFQANILLIPFSVNKNISFSLKDALLKEYHTDYDRSFYQFENDIGCILANIMHKVFARCIPNANLHFINSISNYSKTILKFKPHIKPHNKSSHKDEKHLNHISIRTDANNESSEEMLSFHPHFLLSNNLNKYNTSRSSNSHDSNLDQKSSYTNEPIKYDSKTSNSKKDSLGNEAHYKSFSSTRHKSLNSISNNTNNINKQSKSSLSQSVSSTSSHKNSRVPSRINIKRKKVSFSNSSKSNSLKRINLMLIIVISFLVGILFVVLIQLFKL